MRPMCYLLSRKVAALPCFEATSAAFSSIHSVSEDKNALNRREGDRNSKLVKVQENNKLEKTARRNKEMMIDKETANIQSVFKRRQHLDPRDQFGSMSKARMNQPEPTHQKGFQPDIWTRSYEITRVVKEREKTFREKLEDEFSEGRVPQITQPLYVTVKNTLKKTQRLGTRRAEKKKEIKKPANAASNNELLKIGNGGKKSILNTEEKQPLKIKSPKLPAVDY